MPFAQVLVHAGQAPPHAAHGRRLQQAAVAQKAPPSWKEGNYKGLRVFPSNITRDEPPITRDYPPSLLTLYGRPLTGERVRVATGLHVRGFRQCHAGEGHTCQQLSRPVHHVFHRPHDAAGCSNRTRSVKMRGAGWQWEPQWGAAVCVCADGLTRTLSHSSLGGRCKVSQDPSSAGRAWAMRLLGRHAPTY